MSVQVLSYKESDVRARNILQSLTYNMAEKQLAYMKKLRHCHPMYRRAGLAGQCQRRRDVIREVDYTSD